MNKGVKYFLIAVVAVGVVAGVALLASVYFQGGSGKASEPISAPELALDSTATVELTATETMVPETVEPAQTEEATAEPTVEATVEPSATQVPAASAERRLYRITQTESQVRFELNEDLFGRPNQVVGTTDQVAGDVIIDFTNPASSELGQIRVNARTLATDNDFRNRAIRSQILQSSQDQYEYIEFTPTALQGLPDSAAVGDTVNFQIVGDLKIRDITHSVTFDATVTITAADRLEGSAQAQVLRGDFDLQIPSVPNVANVTNEVSLYINFVALEVTQ